MGKEDRTGHPVNELTPEEKQKLRERNPYKRFVTDINRLTPSNVPIDERMRKLWEERKKALEKAILDDESFEVIKRDTDELVGTLEGEDRCLIDWSYFSRLPAKYQSAISYRRPYFVRDQYREHFLDGEWISQTSVSALTIRAMEKLRKNMSPDITF